VGRCGLNASDLGWGPVAVSYKHGSEPSVSIKECGEFLDQLSEEELCSVELDDA
jgi:hypothetical protein